MPSQRAAEPAFLRRILVLNKGEVVEFDAPGELLSRPGGHFALMAPFGCNSWGHLQNCWCLGLWPRKESMPEKFTKASL